MTADDQHDIDRLVDRARAGDAAAFGGIYDLFAEPVYRFLRFRLGNAHDAEDLLHVVFVKMIEALPRYQPRGLPFRAWVYRIARNAVIDDGRVRRTHEPLDTVDPTFASRDRTDPAASVPERLAIEAALEVLTPEQRDVIAYRFFVGLTPAEIAAIMGRREGSIRALQFRALGALRRGLGATAHGTVSDRTRIDR